MKAFGKWFAIIGVAWSAGLLLQGSIGDQKTYLQLMVVPFIALGAMLIQIREMKLPRSVILLFVLGACGGFFWSERGVLTESKLGVSRLRNDPDDHATRIFIAHLELPYVRHIFETAETAADARGYLRKEKKLSMLVSGDENFLILSFSRGSTSSDATVTLPNSYELFIGAPQVGLSYLPLDGTSSFIRLMSQGFSPDIKNVDRTILLKAAEVESPWRSFAHRSLPLFLAATNLMLTDPSQSELAEQWLTTASGYLRPNDNGVLRGAILNNLAVIRLLRNESRSEIEQTFIRAVETEHERGELSDDNRAWKCAKRNLKRYMRSDS